MQSSFIIILQTQLPPQTAQDQIREVDPNQTLQDIFDDSRKKEVEYKISFSTDPGKPTTYRLKQVVHFNNEKDLAITLQKYFNDFKSDRRVANALKGSRTITMTIEKNQGSPLPDFSINGIVEFVKNANYGNLNVDFENLKTPFSLSQQSKLSRELTPYSKKYNYLSNKKTDPNAGLRLFWKTVAQCTIYIFTFLALKYFLGSLFVALAGSLLAQVLLVKGYEKISAQFKTKSSEPSNTSTPKFDIEAERALRLGAIEKRLGLTFREMPVVQDKNGPVEVDVNQPANENIEITVQPPSL